MSDLLTRVAQRDPRAIEQCIDLYGPLVQAMARRMLRNAEDAEDAVQDIFAEIWSSADRFDPNQGSEKAMIVTIARRRLIDRLRKSGRRPKPEELHDNVAATVDADVLEAAEEQEQARSLLAFLKPEQKRLLELAIYRGYSHQEISREMGLPLGTIKTHLRRTIQFLKELARSNPVLRQRRFAQ
ncbi:MAG TPA: sigma-70 family RNA polymerase sigma factor [Planctomycetota bacterium]|mgnify:CR=1 FL=1|nr:sigma-70 family RNA polymerase sigma factor [Planctomycetota bacterium]